VVVTYLRYYPSTNLKWLRRNRRNLVIIAGALSKIRIGCPPNSGDGRGRNLREDLPWRILVFTLKFASLSSQL
jgi:hypothetical protein